MAESEALVRATRGKMTIRAISLIQYGTLYSVLASNTVAAQFSG